MTLLHRNFRCMASDVTIDVAGPRFEVDQRIDEAIQVFRSIEISCTRFNAESPLMRANANSTKWNSLPPIAIEVIRAAFGAYRLTDGVFDPRILGDLLKSGYDQTLRFEEAIALRNAKLDLKKNQIRTIWQPEFRDDEVLIGELPIDLGGIGKGFAVQRAMELLQDCADGVLINAGGDIAAEGFNEGDEKWRIGIENPWDAEGEPVRVVELEDEAIATSSIRLRSWIRNGILNHHLIDPSTGRPGGEGLVAVSSVATTATMAEIWSKTLFLKGHVAIRAFAEECSIPTCWIDTSGNVFANHAFDQRTIWAVERPVAKN